MKSLPPERPPQQVAWLWCFRLLFTATLFASSQAMSTPPTLVRAEQSLRNVKLPKDVDALKLHIFPCFHTPLFIEVVLAEKASVTVFRTSGKFPYYKGPVELHYQRSLHSEDLRPWRKELDALLLVPEKEEKQPLTRDGDLYVLEVSIHGAYHRIERWTPDVDIKERNLEEFASTCKWIIGLCGVVPYRTATKPTVP